MRIPFYFPDVVDEVTVRVVAGLVLSVTLVAALTQQWWLYALIAVDFALRIAFGPRSPFAQIALKVIRPRISAPERLTAGVPKRFAASIGLACSLLILAFAALGWTIPLWIFATAMVVFPFLEAAFGVCVGCRIFSLLIRAGVVPERICVECADISGRLAKASGRPASEVIDLRVFDTGIRTPQTSATVTSPAVEQTQPRSERNGTVGSAN